MKKKFNSTQKSQIENEEKYRRLFELESDAIFLIDNETGDILEVNEAACKLYGYSYDALIKMKHTDLSVEPKETRRVTLAGKTFVPVRWHRKKDQTVFPVEIVANHFSWRGRPVHIAAIRDITERVRVEEALRESEERSRSLIDHNPDAVYSLNAEGIFLRVNDSTCRISGYSREELMRINFDPLIVPEDKARVWAYFKKALHGDPQNYETTILRKDRCQVIMHITNTPTIVKGKIVGVYGIAKDITERKRAEEEIQRARRDWENIFQAIGSPAVVLDPRHRIIAANQAVLSASGLSREEIMGRACYEIFHGRDAAFPADACPMERLLATGQPERCPMEMEAFGGTYLVFCMPIFDKDGHIEKVIHIATDITDRVLAERALRESEEKYRSLFDHSTDAILLTMPDGTILDANPAACMMFGRSREEILRIGRSALVDHEDPRFYTALKKRDANGAGMAEIAMIRANGDKFPVEITSAIFDDASGQQKTSMIIRDTTERKQAEKALRERDVQYKKLSIHVPGMIYQFMRKPDGTYCVPYTTESIQSIFGCLPQDVRKDYSPIAKVILADDLKEVIRSIEFSASRMSIWQCEFRVQIPGQPIRWILGHSTPELLTDGSIIWHGFITDVTERKQIEQDNKRISEKLRALAARLQAVREEERARIAREIHDELGGALTGIKIDLAVLIKEASAISDESLKRLLLDQMHSTTKIIDKTIRTVRKIATELRPGMLDDLGIVAALKWQLNDFKKRTGIHCKWISSLDTIDLNGQHLTALFRIFQETLTNVGRHANANEVQVWLQKEMDAYVLEVQDNGKGITTGDMEGKGSLGILGMRERALTFGGSIDIQGKTGRGTKVTVKIPVK